MKIVFVVSAMNGGGAERVIATLANKYAAGGDDVTILMVAGNVSVYPLDQRIALTSIGRPSRGNPLIQIKRLYAMRQYFKAHADCHIVAFSTRINLFAILAGSGLKLSLTVSERNDPRRYNHPLLRDKIYAWGAGRNTRFVFQTEDAQKCFCSKIRERSEVIPNPLRADLPQPYTGVREKKIAAVGRLEAQKNYRLLLQAFGNFQKRYPEYELHIFGKGSLEKELKEYARKLDIADQVFFEGFRKDVLERIRTYDMYVLSSDYEGISNALMEAMALGLLCISTNCPIGGSAMCINNGENGLLVPTKDAAAMQAAMERLAGDQAAAFKIRENAIKIRDTFAEEKIVEMWKGYIGGYYEDSFGGRI